MSKSLGLSILHSNFAVPMSGPHTHSFFYFFEKVTAYSSQVNLKVVDSISSSRYLLLEGTFNDKPIYIHNVYAPVNQRDQPSFFDQLPRLDPNVLQIAGGDFNNIIDRLFDDQSASQQSMPSFQAFQRWREECGLIDSWRYMDPDSSDFTHKSRRIDMILVNEELSFHVYEAKHLQSFSDHKIVRTTFNKNWVKFENKYTLS